MSIYIASCVFLFQLDLTSVLLSDSILFTSKKKKKKGVAICLLICFVYLAICLSAKQAVIYILFIHPITDSFIYPIDITIDFL